MRGSNARESKTCATHMSLFSSFFTWTRARDVSWHHTIMLSTYRRGWATGRTQAKVVVVCVEPSWTRNLSMRRPAASAKLHEVIARVFRPSLGDSNWLTRELPRNREGLKKHNLDWLIFSLPLQSRTQWGSGCVCCLFQCSSGSGGKPLTTGTRFQISSRRALCIARWSGRQTDASILRSPELCNVQRTSLQVETGNRCQQKHCNTGGDTRSKSRCCGGGHFFQGRSCRTPLRESSGCWRA